MDHHSYSWTSIITRSCPLNLNLDLSSRCRSKMQEHLSAEMKKYNFGVLTPCLLEDKVLCETWINIADNI